jgi:transposase
MWQEGESRQRSPSALTDAQGALVEPLIPPAKPRPRGGRPREVERRAGLTTMLDLHRSGGHWAMLPHDGLPKRTVSDDLAPWRDDGTWTRVVQAWRARHRVAAGRAPPEGRRQGAPSGQAHRAGGARARGGWRPAHQRAHAASVGRYPGRVEGRRDDQGRPGGGRCGPDPARPRPSTGRSPSGHARGGPSGAPSRPRSLEGHASRGWAPHRADAAGGHDRRHATGATLGAGAHERLAGSVPETPQGRGATRRSECGDDPHE